MGQHGLGADAALEADLVAEVALQAVNLHADNLLDGLDDVHAALDQVRDDVADRAAGVLEVEGVVLVRQIHEPLGVLGKELVEHLGAEQAAALGAVVVAHAQDVDAVAGGLEHALVNLEADVAVLVEHGLDQLRLLHHVLVELLRGIHHGEHLVGARPADADRAALVLVAEVLHGAVIEPVRIRPLVEGLELLPGLDLLIGEVDHVPVVLHAVPLVDVAVAQRMGVLHLAVFIDEGRIFRADVGRQIHDAGIDVQDVLHLVGSLDAEVLDELFPGGVHALHGGRHAVGRLMHNGSANALFGSHVIIPLMNNNVKYLIE